MQCKELFDDICAGTTDACTITAQQYCELWNYLSQDEKLLLLLLVRLCSQS